MGDYNQAQKSAQTKLPNPNGTLVGGVNKDVLTPGCSNEKDEEKKGIDWQTYQNTLNNALDDAFNQYRSSIVDFNKKEANRLITNFTNLANRQPQYAQTYQNQLDQQLASLNSRSGTTTITTTIYRVPNRAGGYNYGYTRPGFSSSGAYGGSLTTIAGNALASLANSGQLAFPTALDGTASAFSQRSYTHTYNLTPGTDAPPVAPSNVSMEYQKT